MKTLKSLTALFFALVLTTLVGQEAQAQIRPNLSVSAITPLGGLTQGSGNRIRVTIVNSGMVGVNTSVPIVMKLTQGRKNKIVQRTLSSIGPNDRNGQSVVFDNLTISSAGSVRVQVDIDPKERITESSRRDNRRVQTFQVAQQPTTVADGATLTVRACHLGTTSGIQSARVLVKRNGSNLMSGWTNANGFWQASGVDSGTLTVEVSRNGFYTKNKTFNMGSNNRELKFEMRAGG